MKLHIDTSAISAGWFHEIVDVESCTVRITDHNNLNPGWRKKLTTYLQLVLRLRMNGAVTILAPPPSVPPPACLHSMSGRLID